MAAMRLNVDDRRRKTEREEVKGESDRDGGGPWALGEIGRYAGEPTLVALSHRLCAYPHISHLGERYPHPADGPRSWPGRSFRIRQGLISIQFGHCRRVMIGRLYDSGRLAKNGSGTGPGTHTEAVNGPQGFSQSH